MRIMPLQVMNHDARGFNEDFDTFLLNHVADITDKEFAPFLLRCRRHNLYAFGIGSGAYYEYFLGRHIAAPGGDIPEALVADYGCIRKAVRYLFQREREVIPYAAASVPGFK